MPLIAKILAPLPGAAVPSATRWRPAIGPGNCVVTAPPGHMTSDALASALVGVPRPALWLSLGREDVDPAILLESILAMARRLVPGLGRAADLGAGFDVDWSSGFRHLAADLGDALPEGVTVVIEHAHRLAGTPRTFRVLVGDFLNEVPPRVPWILTSQMPTRLGDLSGAVRRVDAAALRVSSRDAEMYLHDSVNGLADRTVRRASALAGGRPSVLTGVAATGAYLGAGSVQAAAQRSRDLGALLARIVHEWLAATDVAGRAALQLGLLTEYLSPHLVAAAVGAVAIPSGPWLQELDGGWVRLRPLWRAPLRDALSLARGIDAVGIRNAARYLASSGAVERAVPLLLARGEIEPAAATLAPAVPALAACGAWQSLRSWLDQVPARQLAQCPELCYCKGELAVCDGNVAAARRAFGRASRSFAMRHDTAGTGRSLLAESALSNWCGDAPQAEVQAAAALAVAEAGGDPRLSAWSAWQVACVQAGRGELEEAAASLDYARAAAANDPVLPTVVDRTAAWVVEMRDQRRREIAHADGLHLAAEAEQAAAAGLRNHLAHPLDGIPPAALAGATVPLMVAHCPPPVSMSRRGSGRRLLGWQARMARAWRALFSASPAADEEARAWPGASSDVPSEESPARGATTVPVPPTAVRSHGFAPAIPGAGVGPSARAAPPTAVSAAGSWPEAVAGEDPSALQAHLLGAFRLYVAGQAVPTWKSGRGRAVLKYLLAHREHPVPREVLMDAFWPDAAPDAARNSLNVALHALRQTLREVTDLGVVEYRDSGYTLGAGVSVWVDTEAFQQHVRRGRRLDDLGAAGAAAAEYEQAALLYQGDFLDDDPYEEWAVLTRERLRVLHLETLDRLSEIHFAQGQYGAAAEVCRRILEGDRCREDAHARLMRCLSRMGQHHLALRQYQACVEALRDELDFEPDPETTALWQRIRHHEDV